MHDSTEDMLVDICTRNTLRRFNYDPISAVNSCSQVVCDLLTKDAEYWATNDLIRVHVRCVARLAWMAILVTRGA